MRTILCFAVVLVSLTLSPRSAPGQDKPKLLSINGFMVRGVFTELEPAQARRKLSLTDLKTLHLDGKSTDIHDILNFMARAERLKAKIDEPLEVRGEIPLTLPPNTTGNEAYTTCFYAFNLNGLVVAGVGEQLLLIRREARRQAPLLERTWNRDQILSIRLFRLGYLKSDGILAQYKDKIGTRTGRAILEPKSNMVIIADKSASLAKLEHYIDAEALESMGVPASAGRTPADSLRPPHLGAIVTREHIHFYLMAFARLNNIPLSGSKQNGVLDRHYPEANVWMSEPGYRTLETEYQRVNEYFQLARKTGGEDWPVPNDDRTLSPAEQNRLEIQFGIVQPEPSSAPAAKSKTKSKKNARKR